MKCSLVVRNFLCNLFTIGGAVINFDFKNICGEQIPIYLHAEVQTLRPTIILAVGKLAILELLKDAGVSKTTPLSETVGKIFRIEFAGVPVQVIPLPHPSGVSRWPQTEPGKTILQRALDQIGREVRGVFTPEPS